VSRTSIAEILEQIEREREAERTLELAQIGEHTCRPVRRYPNRVVCETCGEPMRETSVLRQIARKQVARRKL
jgi:formylmethanofuran dehydrogenase subunit E